MRSGPSTVASLLAVLGLVAAERQAAAVEETAVAETATSVGNEGQTPVYEPSPAGTLVPIEPQPPPAPLPGELVAPRRSFWLGLRAEWLMPRGTVWSDGDLVRQGNVDLCCVYTDRRITEFAKSGPALEADLGARFARRYMVFTYWQHGFFRDGSGQPEGVGKQKRAASDLIGLGLRFSTDPSDIGFVLEVGIGYRRFKATYEGIDGDPGASLVLEDEFLSSRLGLGADFRLTPEFSLSPLILFSGGAFQDPAFYRTDGVEIDPASAHFERIRASYITITFSVGSHFDIY